jgi:carbon-monoxide dehydrogenase iron sulfur subunit
MANMQTVFINPERCIGCRQCEFACAVAHSESKNPALALAEDPVPKPRIEQVCPTGAMARDARHDLVLVDSHKCIACAMCAMVCPFDAVTFHVQANGMPARIDRLDNGQEPACVEACKVDALLFGDLNTLIAADRLHMSDALLAATTSKVPTEGPPASVSGWRIWGESAAHISEEI